MKATHTSTNVKDKAPKDPVPGNALGESIRRGNQKLDSAEAAATAPLTKGLVSDKRLDFERKDKAGSR